MAETWFSFLNLLPLPIWLSMMLFPKQRFTQKMVLSYWPFIVLGGLYTLFLLISLVTSPGGFDLSFDALRQSLTQEWAFVAAWTHYLALDLFAGVWIFRDAKYWGITPTWFLLFTLLAGPFGLASYLLWRQRKKRNDPIRTLN